MLEMVKSKAMQELLEEHVPKENFEVGLCPKIKGVLERDSCEGRCKKAEDNGWCCIYAIEAKRKGCYDTHCESACATAMQYLREKGVL